MNKEFAQNAGAQAPDEPWLLDEQDNWVPNPCYQATNPAGAASVINAAIHQAWNEFWPLAVVMALCWPLIWLLYLTVEDFTKLGDAS